MDKLDESIEGANALVWDEEIPGSKFSEIIASAPSTAEHHGNITRQVSPSKVPTAIAKIQRTMTNNGMEQKAGRPDPTSLEHHRHPKLGRSKKYQTAKNVEWGQQNAVNTKRKQDHLDKEAKKAAKSMEFLGLPTVENLPAEGYYFCSDISIDPGSFLGENMDFFDDIRMNCEVYIDFVESLGCIRLRSKGRRNIENGVTKIKAKIQHAGVDAASHAPIYIVEPPAVGTMRSKVTPIFQDSPSVGKQPTIIGVILAGPLINVEERVKWGEERQAVIERNKDRFYKHMLTTLAELSSLKNIKQMRTNLGKTHLLRYRKDIGGGYSFQKLSNMMEEICTQGKFQRIIPGASVARSILDRFSTATSLLEPIDSLASDLADVKAKHSLVMIAHGPSKQSVRIEAEIDLVQCPTSRKTHMGVTWQIGTIKYYHHRHNSQKTRLTVGILSVEAGNFDACLEITTEEVMAQPPKVFQKLVEGSISGTSTFAIQNSKLLFPAIRILVPGGVVVDSVQVKSALQYKLQHTSYIAEVTVHHGWNNSNTGLEPEISCSVSLYHKDWDLLMASGDGVERPTALAVDSLFPDESRSGNGISSFLTHIQTLQGLISPVITGMSVPVNA